jgi:hypothetical protein
MFLVEQPSSCMSTFFVEDQLTCIQFIAYLCGPKHR